jgi:hypothetical protein
VRGLFSGESTGGRLLLREQEYHLYLGEHEIFQRQAKEAQVMLLEPLFEESVGQKNMDSVILDGTEAEGTKPGLKALPTDSISDYRKCLIPEFARVRRRHRPFHKSPSG